jgi:hypothetical protein
MYVDDDLKEPNVTPTAANTLLTSELLENTGKSREHNRGNYDD